MPSLQISEVARRLDALAPLSTAESWDNVGLLLGSAAARTSGVVVSIDLTTEAIAVAVRRKFRLVITHHPAIFPKGRGPSRILDDSVVHAAIKAGLSVYAAHTNFDRCALEVSERIAHGLRSSILGRLVESPSESLRKLAVFVPASHLDAVRDAVFAAGAGHVGHYDACSFTSEGFGTFRGAKGTQPFLGKPGTLEHVTEQKLEVVFPAGLEAAVVRAMREAHPYEEVAYDLWKLANPPAPGGVVRGLGYGFYGDLSRPVPLAKLLPRIWKTFGTRGATCTGKEAGLIKRVAFSPGKGSDFVGAAIAAGCDLFITGETGYHPARDAAGSGLRVIELGHTESEHYFPKVMGSWLKPMGLAVAELSSRIQRKVN